jgi:L-asparaginase
MRQESAFTVILGTGGTIAGVADDAHDNLGYQAGQISVRALVEAVPALRQVPLQVEQVAQLDSKDMDARTWHALAGRLAAHLQRPEVTSLVVTHGTDTLEETAWFLQRVLEPMKPVVLTAAMRPASSLQADGPQNLLDAVSVARASAAHGRHGVMAVLASRIWPAFGLRKSHPYRLDAFDAGDVGALGAVEEGRVRWWRDAPAIAAWPVPMRAQMLGRDPEQWPAVAIVSSHALADGREVDALVQAGFEGIVVAGTGHATVHQRLEVALAGAERRGVQIWRASRCTAADVAPALDPLLSLTPWQARVELLLRLSSR